MQITFDDIKEFLKLIESVIILILPVIVTIYYKVSKKTREKLDELRVKDSIKNNQELLNFSHEKSMASMHNLKDVCNLFFDKSHADRILYFQLENGTTADSQLQNMFITCMAESDRFSRLPEWMHQVQRMPVQSIISFIENVNKTESLEIMFDEDGSSDQIDERIKKSLFPENINALRIQVIRNTQGYIIGYVTFEYLFDLPSDKDAFYTEDERILINECRSSIETELLRYRNLVRAKKHELKIKEEN